MEIEKLNIKDKDAILLMGCFTPNEIIDFSKNLQGKYKDLAIIVLGRNQSIEILDEKAMNDSGWYREVKESRQSENTLFSNLIANKYAPPCIHTNSELFDS